MRIFFNAITLLLIMDPLGNIPPFMSALKGWAKFRAKAMGSAYETLREHGSLRDHLDLVYTFDDFNRVVDLDRHYGLESRYVEDD